MHRHVEADRRRHAGDLHFLAEDVELDRGPILATPLGRPARHGPALGVQAFVGGDDVVLRQFAAFDDFAADGQRDLVLEERAHFGAEGVFLGAEAQVHRRSPRVIGALKCSPGRSAIGDVGSRESGVGKIQRSAFTDDDHIAPSPCFPDVAPGAQRFGITWEHGMAGGSSAPLRMTAAAPIEPLFQAAQSRLSHALGRETVGKATSPCIPRTGTDPPQTARRGGLVDRLADNSSRQRAFSVVDDGDVAFFQAAAEGDHFAVDPAVGDDGFAGVDG